MIEQQMMGPKSATFSQARKIARASMRSVCAAIVEHTSMLTGSFQKLARVITNILKNAVEAIESGPTPSAGRIELRTSDATIRGQHLFRLEMFNNGPPIPTAHLADIFDSYASFGKERGTGLGLSAARQIVQLHGGTLTVANSEAPQGVCFTLALPALDLPDPEQPSPTALDLNASPLHARSPV